MKFNNIYLTLLLICTLGLITGCKKFLTVGSPTSSVNPIAIKDFQEMLNSDSLGRVQYFLLDAMSDDVQLSDAQTASAGSFYRKAYFYENTVWNAADVDRIYNGSYARILQMNIILSRINDAPQDALNTPQNKANVMSQALIHRAYFYLQLVNAYAKAYDDATAGTDPGVPLVLVPDATALPSRASVEQVYGQIIGDLKMAINNPYIGSQGNDIIHPGKAAAFALLARAYLYKGDYTNAEIYADSTLARVNTLTNYNSATYLAPTQFQDLTANPEILMGKLTSDEVFYSFYQSAFRISTCLKTLLTTADTRYSKRYVSDIYRTSTTPVNTYAMDNSVAVPEVLLTKAECLARAGKVTDAAAILTRLRSNRITSTDTRTFTAANILQNVLDDRRRELFLHGGLRLFDLKRLNKATASQITITRTNVAGNTVLATVAPGSNRYILPFSSNVLAANPYITQNSRL